MRFKICSKCNLEKDLELFSFRTASKDGRHTICKECVSKYDKARYCSSKRMKKYYANHLTALTIADGNMISFKCDCLAKNCENFIENMKESMNTIKIEKFK